MVLVFAAAAVVQFDDPDPMLWVLLYGGGSLCCLLFLMGRCPLWLPAGLSGLYGLSSLYLLGRVVFTVGFLDPTGEEMMGVTETGRELLGIVLMAGWTGLLALRRHSLLFPSREKKINSQ